MAVGVGYAEVGETLHYLVAATGSPYPAATERGPPGAAGFIAVMEAGRHWHITLFS